jgi:hypothetical protein
MGTEDNFLTAAELTDLLLEHQQCIDDENDIGQHSTSQAVRKAFNRIPARHRRHITTIINDDNPSAGKTLNIIIGNSSQRQTQEKK